MVWFYRIKSHDCDIPPTQTTMTAIMTTPFFAKLAQSPHSGFWHKAFQDTSTSLEPVLGAGNSFPAEADIVFETAGPPNGPLENQSRPMNLLLRLPDGIFLFISATTLVSDFNPVGQALTGFDSEIRKIPWMKDRQKIIADAMLAAEKDLGAFEFGSIFENLPAAQLRFWRVAFTTLGLYNFGDLRQVYNGSCEVLHVGPIHGNQESPEGAPLVLVLRNGPTRTLVLCTASHDDQKRPTSVSVTIVQKPGQLTALTPALRAIIADRLAAVTA